MLPLQERIDKILQKFKQFANWEQSYRYLIELGQSLESLPEKDQIDSNLVKGCQSQVWLVSEWQEGKIYFRADSDAAIVKGIVALLLSVYSDATAEEILATKPDFVEEIGLKQHLSMNRANGLASLLKQIFFYAVAFKAKYNSLENNGA